MLVLISKVGTNCGIIDTDDGVIDWVDTSEIKDILKTGIVIQGIDSQGTVFKPQSVGLNSALCNWDNGSNIFRTATLFSQYPNGTFKLHTRNKVYKGVIQNNVLYFSFNVAVAVDNLVYNCIMQRR